MWPSSVTKADLNIVFFRAGGPGGQNQNKRDSACRITHLPTGISSESRVHKEQLKNKEEAFKKLAKKLIPLMRAALCPEIKHFKSNERIRTYNRQRNTVKDHRTGKEADFDMVLNGDLDLLA